MSKFFKYYNNDKVGVQFCKLFGIKNPELFIMGSVNSNDFDLDVTEDGKKVEINIIPLSSKSDFCVEAPFNPKSKIIRFYVTIEGKRNLIIQVRNLKLFRVVNRMKGSARIMFSKIKTFFRLIYRFFKFAWREYHFLIPPAMLGKYFKMFIFRMKNDPILFYNPFEIGDYNKWLKENDYEEETLNNFKYRPLISVIIPVYNISRKLLSECLNSILNQTYDNFEICLVDDCSTQVETIKTLSEYEKRDSRIKVKYRKTNGNISTASNDAISMASGEFIALVDDDDTLMPNAFYENVKVLNQNNSIDMIYSDEDKLDLKGNRCDPNFKPDFSPDTLMSLNYICHLTLLRRSIVNDIGGFTVGLDGAQDYDLFLRFSEKTNHIYHISKILYHWRMVKGSTSMSLSSKDYASDKSIIALENALKRRNLKGYITKDNVSQYYITHYEVQGNPLISIIIPTRDYADILKSCLESIYKKTSYKNYEVIIANNNSVESETYDLFKTYQNKYKNFKIIDINTEFNYSNINNIAIKSAQGEYIVLLNNDTEIISENWLTEMVGYASLPHVGTVGPKLLYSDMTVQHGGVILGLGGVASHAYIGANRDDAGMFGRLRVPYNYSAVTAACLMVSKKKYEEVGGLEEDLMVAYNDIDFNIKLLEKGYYNVFLPQVEIIHYESKSRGLDTSPEKYKRFLKESKYMYDKWENILQNDVMYNSNFSKRGWFVLDIKKNRK
jgi:glycosyltransferase involved in cell wall biosynthesis